MMNEMNKIINKIENNKKLTNLDIGIIRVALKMYYAAGEALNEELELKMSKGKNGRMIKKVKKFITEVKRVYPKLNINYNYDSNLDEYDIWHDDFNLEKNKDFKKIIGDISQGIFFDNNIYNFSFGYGHDKIKR